MVYIKHVYGLQVGDTARMVLGEEPPVSRLRKISNWGPRRQSVKSVTSRKRRETESEFDSQGLDSNSMGGSSWSIHQSVGNGGTSGK